MIALVLAALTILSAGASAGYLQSGSVYAVPWILIELAVAWWVTEQMIKRGSAGAGWVFGYGWGLFSVGLIAGYLVPLAFHLRITWVP